MTIQTEPLFSFLTQAVSPYHAVRAGKDVLRRHGYEELPWTQAWHLHQEGSYFVSLYGSALMAFHIGKNVRSHVRLAAAHTDFPCLRIKPQAVAKQRVYSRLNVEVYGGMNRSTWLDRPLSLAGKIVLRSSDAFQPRTQYVNLKRPLLTIPSLAIHMEPKTNDGLVLNPQKDMLPLFSCDGTELAEESLLTYLAAALRVDSDAILAYELTAYPVEPPCYLGAHDELISASRLDNMTSVLACLDGLVTAKEADGLSLIALFDNEEVGSRTKQGALSAALPNLLQRIYAGLGLTQNDYLTDLSRAFLLSVDVAHALHPNAPEKNDITNFPVLNGGVVLKTAASQSYVGDAESIAIIRALCETNDIPWQYYVNRSDIRGGSTLGSLVSANLAIRAMDIGVPLLAMHSARELMGTRDQDALTQLLTAFFAG